MRVSTCLTFWSDTRVPHLQNDLAIFARDIDRKTYCMHAIAYVAENCPFLPVMLSASSTAD